MKNTTKEIEMVEYSKAAINTNHFIIEPNKQCFRAHWHDRMEFLRIRSGELHIECGTITDLAKSGDLVIIPPKFSHKGYTKSQQVEYDLLMFDIRYFYNETEICKNILPAFFDGTAKLNVITNDLETINSFDAIYNLENKNSLKTTANVYQFLSVLFENNVLYFEKIQNNNLFQEIISFIEDNYDKDLNIADISNKFGYSAAHFSRKFKSITGLSPISYLNILRLENAYKMLKEDYLTISEISAKCGFPDSNYFTRCFKKHFGKPPTMYKIKNHKKTSTH